MIGHIQLLSTTASLLLLSNTATALALAPLAESANTKALLTRDTDPISVDDACKFQHGSGFSAQTVGNGCNDWVCVRGNERKGVDLKKRCCSIDESWNCCNVDALCSNGVNSWVCWYGAAC